MIVWGLVLIVLSLLAWGGQTLSFLAPATAARLGLAEAEDDVDPLYWADIRGEAGWDMVSLWTALAAGILLVADVSAWAYFGLVGGGAYLYFAGRGISTRLVMRRAELRIGTPANITTALVFLAVWGTMAAVTIGLAVADLEGSL